MYNCNLYVLVVIMACVQIESTRGEQIDRSQLDFGICCPKKSDELCFRRSAIMSSK